MADLEDLVSIIIALEDRLRFRAVEDAWMSVIPHGAQHVTVEGPVSAGKLVIGISRAFRDFLLERGFPFADKQG
jgi:hypothetical protein